VRADHLLNHNEKMRPTVGGIRPVPEGHNMNSRGRKPTEVCRNPFDPCGVEPFLGLTPWVSPTAIHVWPFRGLPVE
jgi:hypothetical protein